MTRLMILVFIFTLLTMPALAQLPTQDGQYWMEYPISPALLHPPKVSQYEERNADASTAPKGPSVLDLIRRETGPEVWNGRPMGLLGADNEKIYVYHNYDVQKKVAETIDRFLRQDTRKLRFVLEMTNITLPAGFFEKAKIDDLRQPVYQYLHPILAPDGQMSKCRTPGAAAYWVAREDVSRLQAGLEKIFTAVYDQNRPNILQAPMLLTYNGQMGALMDAKATLFTTDLIRESAARYRPVKRQVVEGQTIGAFSLLSWDRKTVTTDLMIDFRQIGSVAQADMARADEKSAATVVQTPMLHEVSLVEENLTWPAGGMLIVFLGVERLSEPESGKKGKKDKKREPERTQVYSIVTVKVYEPTKPSVQGSPGGAGAPKLTDRMPNWMPRFLK